MLDKAGSSIWCLLRQLTTAVKSFVARVPNILAGAGSEPDVALPVAAFQLFWLNPLRGLPGCCRMLLCHSCKTLQAEHTISSCRACSLNLFTAVTMCIKAHLHLSPISHQACKFKKEGKILFEQKGKA
jgi:hypothetical protein